MKTIRMCLRVCLLAAIAFGNSTPGPTRAAEPQVPTSSRLPLLTDFDRPFTFEYLSFQGKITVAGGVAHIQTQDGKGGAGILDRRDLTSVEDDSPAMWIKVGPNNRAKQIKLTISSANEKKRMFAYSLVAIGGGEFVRVLPEDCLALNSPVLDDEQQDFDPSQVTQYHVQGDWSAEPVDVRIDRIELVPPTPEMIAQRTQYAKRIAEKAERQRRAATERDRLRRELLAGAPHPADGPDVRHVAAVAPEILDLTIQAGELKRSSQQPYQPQPGDEIEEKDEEVLLWEGGRIARGKKGRYLLREDANGRKQRVGALLIDEQKVWPEPEIAGQPLSEATVDEPAAYRIVSQDDPNYRQPLPPKAVHRKSKPTEQAQGKMPVRHEVYLVLPYPLSQGATYRVELVGVNTRQSSVSYTHDPSKVRSEAVHVTQIGYRPGDPFKRAYLSTWLGTGGAVEYKIDQFELLDEANGKAAYQGVIHLGLAADQPELLKEKKNQTQTNVYFLDFHDFRRPGRYRVFVPGVGVSYPFEIGEDVWTEAFQVSMQGYLVHRSGIELGPPLTDYRRPRPMHPDDGVRVFELDVTYWDGESDTVQRSLARQLGPSLDASKLTTYPGAWGGYMDAGDWDRRSQHLTASYQHLELVDLFPDYFAHLKLRLPQAEVENNLPDLIDEALWNLGLYRRLQRENGGVGGGVESTSHPRPGECSWQESLLLGTFAPDPETSYRYAACAAKAARLIGRYDASLAAEYRNSALRAWTWAESHAAAEIAAAAGRGARKPDQLEEDVASNRALAAVELYRLTEEARYHEAFRQATVLGTDGNPTKQLDAIFAYTLLPDRLADAVLANQAREKLISLAEVALQFARGNAFSITTHIPQLPMIGYVGYYSTPEMTVGPLLPRVHYLSGDEKYLAGAVAATQYAAGANPMNITMTTSVGHDWPRGPLHVDSRHSGQEPPEGITVYGPGDPAATDGSVNWAHIWYLSKTMAPESHSWPAAEFYVDLSNWPAMTEYTIHQTMRPTSYYWGYLAARGRAVEP